MIKRWLATLAIFSSLAMAASGDELKIGAFPTDTVWYLHADLQKMRDSESGSRLYEWFDDEVVVEINDKLGIDLNSEVNTVTAFSDHSKGTVMIIEGPVSKSTQDKMLAIAQAESAVDTRTYKGLPYYFIGDGPEGKARNADPFDDLENASYSSFAIDGKVIITANEEQLKALLDSRGKVAGSGSHDGALFVISADKSFVQAGLRTDVLSDDADNDWDSNILRNTKQAALMISDSGGMIAVEARLESTDAKMAEAIGGIINGLVSLQAFNSDLGPEIQGIIRNTKVLVNDAILSITTVIDPDLVVSLIND